MYLITVDYGDNAVEAPHAAANLEELNNYLMSIPGTIGFELFGRCTVKIDRQYSRTRPINHNAATLPGLKA